jgi:hypothetical protein
MKKAAEQRMRKTVLVVDIGGSRVKVITDKEYTAKATDRSAGEARRRINA